MKAIDALRPAFLELPEAFAALMVAVCRKYVACCQTVGREPDAALLGPVDERLRSLDSEA